MVDQQTLKDHVEYIGYIYYVRTSGNCFKKCNICSTGNDNMSEFLTFFGNKKRIKRNDICYN